MAGLNSIPTTKLFLTLIFFSTSSLFLHKVLDIRQCYSPLETVRRFHFLSLLTAPVVTPSLKSLVLHVLSLLSLRLYFSKFNLPINHNLLSFLAQAYASSVILSLTCSSILFYSSFETKSLWISHFFNDCSSGLFHVILPVVVFLLSRKRYSVDLYLIACIVLELLTVALNPQNCIALILSLVSATAVILFKKKRKPSKRDTENNLTNFDSGDPTPVNSGRATSRMCVFLIGAICATILVRHLSLVRLRTQALANEGSISLTIVVHTINRKNNPRYLSVVLESFLEQFPQPEQQKNWHIYPISFDSGEIVFQGLQKMMDQNNVSKHYITFVSQDEAPKMTNSSFIQNDTFKLRSHVAASLKYASHKSSNTTWIMIHEDDFELCANQWPWLVHYLNDINQENSVYCGFFVATGGAGIVIRPDIVSSVIDALLDPKLSEPADIIMQNCLRGRYADHCLKCAQGKGKLLISSHLIFRHIGFISSFSSHKYKAEEQRWSCGWRHPFNGDPDVDIVHTDTFS